MLQRIDRAWINHQAEVDKTCYFSYNRNNDMNTPMTTENRGFVRRRTSRNVEMFAAIGMGEEIRTPREWLMFDRACPFCTRAAKEIEPALARRGVGVIPLQTDWAQKFLAERNEPLLKEIRFLNAEGELTGGA